MGSSPQANGTGKIVIGSVLGRMSGPNWRIRGNVNLLSLRNHSKSRQRICILATDEHTDTATIRITHTQTSTISRRPRQLFIKCRDNLAMVIKDRSVTVYQYIAMALSNNSFKTSVNRAGMDLPVFWKERSHGQTGENELQGYELEKI